LLLTLSPLLYITEAFGRLSPEKAGETVFTRNRLHLTLIPARRLEQLIWSASFPIFFRLGALTKMRAHYKQCRQSNQKTYFAYWAAILWNEIGGISLSSSKATAKATIKRDTMTFPI
jgi:hypothetical protein